MNSQSTEVATSSSTDRGGPSGRRRSRSRSLANMIQNEELNDGISKKKPKPKLPMELAFENDVVLLEIFRHSSPSDLKEFRLVNRKWNDTATSTLLIRKSLQIELHELKKYFRDSTESTSDPGTSEPTVSYQDVANGSHRSLTDLCRIIESSAKFPTKSLTFRRNCPESHPQVRQLLKIFGKQVKELTFDYYCIVSVFFLREVLLDLVPNLESLTLRHCTLPKVNLSTTNQEEENSFDFDRIHSLPHLTQLVFVPSEHNWAQLISDYPLHLELFKELVDAASNLRSVYAHPLDFLEILLDAGKSQLVKELDLKPTRKVEKRLVSGHGDAVEVRPVAIYQKLASMKPEIKTLRIRCLTHEDGYGSHQFELLETSMFESAVNSILESSKDSLLDLEIEMKPDYSIELPLLPKPGSSIELPVLPNLKKLTASMGEEAHFNTGPASQDLSFSFHRNFPRLHELHLSLDSYMNVDIKEMFCGKLEKWMSPTVKHLKFEGDLAYHNEGKIDIPDEGPQMLGKMFPNATSVVIVYDLSLYNHQNLSSIIWHQIPADIKSISVGQFAVKEQCKNFQDIVDSFFTGFSIRVCKRLRKLPQRICEEKHVLEAFRSEPSICAFKNLEELNIFCSDLRSDHPFASHVTGLYAFDLMPKLKVTVTYKPYIRLDDDASRKNITPSEDMNRSLKHIAPYITQVCHKKSYNDRINC